MLRRLTWVSGVLAAVLVFTMAVTVSAGLVRGTLRNPFTSTDDCAEIAMRSLDGPDEAVARAAYECLAPVAQQRMSVEAMLHNNAQSPGGFHHVRVGESRHADGSAYVFFDQTTPDRHFFYVIVLDPAGKIVSIT
jgi:hypothetical protein